MRAAHARVDMEEIGLVGVAERPVLVEFEGLNDAVSGVGRVPGGVTVGRGVAASDMATSHAETEMQPRIAGLETLLTSVGGDRLDNTQRFQMLTYLHAAHVMGMASGATRVRRETRSLG